MKNLMLLFFVLLISCNKEDITKQVTVNSKIVVEGSIEFGGYAEVLISRSVPIGVAVDSTTILNYVIRSAKVTVSDGEKQEVLKLKRDNNKIPPYVYFGSEIIGETGKTYSLKIEYLNRLITAITTIPNSVPILSANYIKDNPTDKNGNIFIKFLRNNASDVIGLDQGLQTSQGDFFTHKSSKTSREEVV